MQRLAGLKADSGPLAALYKTHPKTPPPAKERTTNTNTSLEKLAKASRGEGTRSSNSLNI